MQQQNSLEKQARHQCESSIAETEDEGCCLANLSGTAACQLCTANATTTDTELGQQFVSLINKLFLIG